MLAFLWKIWRWRVGEMVRFKPRARLLPFGQCRAGFWETRLSNKKKHVEQLKRWTRRRGDSVGVIESLGGNLAINLGWSKSMFGVTHGNHFPVAVFLWPMDTLVNANDAIQRMEIIQLYLRLVDGVSREGGHCQRSHKRRAALDNSNTKRSPPSIRRQSS